MGSVPVFLRKPIATFDFPEWGPYPLLPSLDPGLNLLTSNLTAYIQLWHPLLQNHRYTLFPTDRHGRLQLFLYWVVVHLPGELHLKYTSTVKPVLSGHSINDKTKVLKANGSLMKNESIAECSLGAFCNTFDLH